MANYKNRVFCSLQAPAGLSGVSKGSCCASSPGPPLMVLSPVARSQAGSRATVRLFLVFVPLPSLRRAGSPKGKKRAEPDFQRVWQRSSPSRSSVRCWHSQRRANPTHSCPWKSGGVCLGAGGGCVKRVCSICAIPRCGPHPALPPLRSSDLHGGMRRAGPRRSSHAGIHPARRVRVCPCPWEKHGVKSMCLWFTLLGSFAFISSISCLFRKKSAKITLF